MPDRDATDLDDKETTLDKCDPNCAAGPRDGAPANAASRDGGPPREAGGTTGAGNLSPGQASRTGGATGGVPSTPDDRAKARNVPPSA
jgi:hypothetical protein